MKKKWNILVVFAIITALVFLFFYYGDNLFAKKEIKTIKVGFLGDLSDEKIGKAALIGTEIAVEELNSKTKSTGNRFELIAYDTKNQNERIESYFDKLTNEDNVMTIISTHTDKEEIAEKLKVPTILIGRDKLDAERGNYFYWGVELSYITTDGVFQAINRVRKDVNISSAVIVVDNTQFIDVYQRYNSAIKGVLPLLNISVINFYEINNNIADLISKIKVSNPDLVILSTNSNNAMKFIEEASSNNLNSKMFIRGSELNAEDIQAKYKNLPDIIYLHMYITEPEVPLPGASYISPFILFDKKIGKRTNGALTSSIHLNSYDAINLLNSILQKSTILNTPENLQKDREEIAKALWATRSYNATRGLLFADGKSGFLRRNYYRIIVMNNGQISQLIGV